MLGPLQEAPTHELMRQQGITIAAHNADDGITFRAGGRGGWDRVAVFADSDFAAPYECGSDLLGRLIGPAQ